MAQLSEEGKLDSRDEGEHSLSLGKDDVFQQLVVPAYASQPPQLLQQQTQLWNYPRSISRRGIHGCNGERNSRQGTEFRACGTMPPRMDQCCGCNQSLHRVKSD